MVGLASFVSGVYASGEIGVGFGDGPKMILALSAHL